MSSNFPETVDSVGSEGSPVTSRGQQQVTEQVPEREGMLGGEREGDVNEIAAFPIRRPSQPQQSGGYWRKGNTTGGMNIPELQGEDPPLNQRQQPQVHGPNVARPESNQRVFYEPIPETHRLGTLSTAALIINKMIGTGIFSKPSDILRLTGSKGGALFLWVAGGVMTLTG